MASKIPLTKLLLSLVLNTFAISTPSAIDTFGGTSSIKNISEADILKIILSIPAKAGIYNLS